MGKVILEIIGKVGDPGALGLLALVGAGAVLCFLGLSHFRFSIGFVGAVVGIELVGLFSMAQGWGTLATVILAVLGGAALSTLFVIFPFLGIFGLGAMLAASLVSLAAHAAHAAVEPLRMVLAALIGGFGALLLRKPVVVVATALYGALMIMASLFALFRHRGVRGAVETMGSTAQTGDVVLFLLCIAVLVTGGIVVQFRYGKNAQLEGGK